MIKYDKLIGIRTPPPPRSFCKDRHDIWHNSALNLKKNFLMVLSFNVNCITIWCFLCDFTRYLVMVFFCNSSNLHTREVSNKTSYCSHIDYIIYYEPNSLHYGSIGQFKAQNRRATEVPKQLLTFYLCQ